MGEFHHTAVWHKDNWLALCEARSARAPGMPERQAEAGSATKAPARGHPRVVAREPSGRSIRRRLKRSGSRKELRGITVRLKGAGAAVEGRLTVL